jgi:hypothetical protein
MILKPTQCKITYDKFKNENKIYDIIMNDTKIQNLLKENTFYENTVIENLEKLTELKNKDKVQYNSLYQKVISVGEFNIL